MKIRLKKQNLESADTVRERERERERESYSLSNVKCAYLTTSNSTKRENGITLIALVVTIVILLILAGISIVALSDNGLFGKTKEAKSRTEYSQAYEELSLKILKVQMDKGGESTLEDVLEELKNDSEYTYIIKLTPTALLSEDGDIKGTDTQEQIATKLSTVDEIYVIYKGYEFKISKTLEVENEMVISEIEEEQKDEEDDDDEEEEETVSYTQNGLILNLNGVESAKSQSSWNDLTANKKNASLYNCTINENNIELNGSSSYMSLSSDALGSYSASTIEIVANSKKKGAVLFTDNSNNSSRGAGIAQNGNIAIYCTPSFDESNLPYMFVPKYDVINQINTYTIIYDGLDYNNTVVYQNGTELEKGNKDGYSNSSSNVLIGRREYDNSLTDWYFEGKIYAFRVYNRKLTEDEVKQNYDTDVKNFE